MAMVTIDFATVLCIILDQFDKLSCEPPDIKFLTKEAIAHKIDEKGRRPLSGGKSVTPMNNLLDFCISRIVNIALVWWRQWQDK